MAIALTADRFGHRRLVLLGTALCLVASLLGAFAGSVDTPAGGAYRRGPGLHRRRGRRPDPAAAHRRRRRPAPRDGVVDDLHAGRRRLDDADRGRRPARHVVAGRLAGGRRPLPRSCSRPCCCARCRGTNSTRVPASRRPVLARDDGSGDQRRPARHRALLRRLFLLLVRRRRLPADAAGRAARLLDLDRRHRHRRWSPS